MIKPEEIQPFGDKAAEWFDTQEKTIDAALKASGEWQGPLPPGLYNKWAEVMRRYQTAGWHVRVTKSSGAATVRHLAIAHPALVPPDVA